MRCNIILERNKLVVNPKQRTKAQWMHSCRIHKATVGHVDAE